MPKVRAYLALGLCYQYLARLVTIVSDREIETIDLVFRIELGEEYLSIVSNWSLDMETESL